jgi:sarcosine oxidase subunit gamma
MTAYQPIKRSPIAARGATLAERAGWQIAERFSSPEAEADGARRGAGICDLSAIGKVLIQGSEAAAALQAAFGAAPARVGELAVVEGGLLACLSFEDWYLTAPVGGEGAAIERFEAAARQAGAQGLAHATDLTHGNAAVLLAGPKGRDALVKVCGLDFHDSAFPDRSAAQSSVARLHTILLRHDLPGGLPAYQLHVSRSEAEYLWGVLADAISEFGGQPFGAAALAQLSA